MRRNLILVTLLFASLFFSLQLQPSAVGGNNNSLPVVASEFTSPAQACECSCSCGWNCGSCTYECWCPTVGCCISCGTGCCNSSPRECMIL
jgi:hypothetical protein